MCVWFVAQTIGASPQCDALGVPGHTVHAKMCAAMHQLCFGGTALQQLSYTRLKPSAAIIALETFTAHVVAVFADEFLRSPTPSDEEADASGGKTRAREIRISGLYTLDLVRLPK